MPYFQMTNSSSGEKAIAVCLLIELKWIQPLAKYLNTSGLNFCTKPRLQTNQYSMTPSMPQTVLDYVGQCLMKRFYCMLFEHFVQISVLMESLTDKIVQMIDIAKVSSVTCARPPNQPQPISIESHTEVHDWVNRAFSDFQHAFRDLCSPKINRPVWSTLCLSYAAEQDEIEDYAFDSVSNVRSWKNQSETATDPIYGTPMLSKHESLTQSFVRGCLCIQISKAIAKDKGL